MTVRVSHHLLWRVNGMSADKVTAEASCGLASGTSAVQGTCPGGHHSKENEETH